MALTTCSYDKKRKMKPEDYEALVKSGCNWRPKNLDNVVIADLLNGYELKVTELLAEEGSFHPNGDCGCILMPDEYIFGLRCNHLIWIAGWHEQVALPTDVDDTEGDSWDESIARCVLFVANHKGALRVAMAYEDDDISDEE